MRQSLSDCEAEYGNLGFEVSSSVFSERSPSSSGRSPRSGYGLALPPLEGVVGADRALAGIPEDRVRYHLCWGSWHGPHTHDLPLEHIIDLILDVKAQTYSFEAANVRHEHEWRVWQQAKLPAGKMLMPGVVSHATNLVEHPQLVADRILRYAQIVGRENVIAGTDSGLGGRVHADLAWAKLRSLAEGARLASKELWA